ncbi:MAG: hypothetical protein KF819_30970 [Labilithrix sp.]|nr:hypothetical protein [Labilithrix sp.]
MASSRTSFGGAAGADRLAERIFAAVEEMSTARRGFVRRMLDGAGTLGLYLPAHVVLFHLDAEGTIHVDMIRDRDTR